MKPLKSIDHLWLVSVHREDPRRAFVASLDIILSLAKSVLASW